MFCDIVVLILNMVAFGLLSVCAFLEKERGDEYRQRYLDAMNRLMELECQREHGDENQRGWCGHCACQSCYDAKRKADHW
jgi:hypothetical protein